ncbi:MULTISPECIES: BF3164 family lipoprotein [Bacteroides]|uniref:BF3164 family lipoprotein n=1 Tax=Bacteroides TaxID=816 RepID=UPI0004B74BBD|nr:BF3164 family lipoprotein [Bacteroides neonati]
MKNYFFYCFFLILTSCWNTTSNSLIEIDDIDYSFTDKEFANVKEIRSTLLNDSMVHRPVRIALHDSVLFSVDAAYSDGFIVRVFSADNGAYQGSLFHRGNGPNEVLSVDDITFSNDYFWAYDITSQKWIGNDFGDIFNKKANTDKRVVDFKSLSYMGVNDPQWIQKGFVANNLFQYKERFSFYTSKGKIINSVFNPKFHFKESFPPAVLSDIFSTHLTVTPDQKKMILVGRYLDVIEIYNTDGQLIKLLKGPKENLDFKFDEEKSMQNSVLIKSPESSRAYLKVRATQERIYALYSGKEKRDKEHYSYSKNLYVFSMEGEPIVKYSLDVPIIDFVVDEARHKIFAVAGSPESELVSFAMQ